MSIGGFGLKREREGRKRLGLPPDLCCLLNILFLFLSFSDIEPSHAIFHIIDLADNAGNLLHFSYRNWQSIL